MELELWGRNYNTYGGLPSGRALAHLFELQHADFGPAIRKIEITLLFHHPGPAKPTLEGLFETVHHYRETQLPKVTFRRSRETVTMEVASDLICGRRWKRLRELPLDLFAGAAAEVVAALRLLRKSVKRKDDFRLEAFLIHVEAALERLPSTEAELAALAAAAAEAEQQRRTQMPWWEVMDLDWRDYHASARELLNDPLFWDCSDEFAPHGNDAGADLLESYKGWLRRSPTAEPLEFYRRHIQRWGYPPGSDDPTLRTKAQDAAVGLAFAELKLRGACRPSAAKLALEALDAQQRDAEDALGWEHRETRLVTIGKLRAALVHADSTMP